jgi:hypothetical protein
MINIKQQNTPAVGTVPCHSTVPVIVVHLCCRKRTELLAVQPILLWFSECVQQFEIPAVTLVISGTQLTVTLCVVYFLPSYKASSLVTQTHNFNSSNLAFHSIELNNNNILIDCVLLVLIMCRK